MLFIDEFRWKRRCSWTSLTEDMPERAREEFIVHTNRYRDGYFVGTDVGYIIITKDIWRKKTK